MMPTIIIHMLLICSIAASKECESEISEETSIWIKRAQKSLKKKLKEKPLVKKAKNVILFLGDGMSISTITATRSIMGGDEEALSFEKFPYVGLSKTYCADSKVADSACSSTAYLCGVKGNRGTLGVNSNVKFNDCQSMMDKENHVYSIAQWFQNAGKVAGIVTTAAVTDASPAGAYAHTASRYWMYNVSVNEKCGDASKCHDIAMQLVRDNPGRDFKVIMGGGISDFLPVGQHSGHRLDQQDLIQEWITQKKATKKPFAFITTKDELLTMDQPVSYLLGLFANKNMRYHLHNHPCEPSLEEMTRKAIDILDDNENGYFLFVEGASIDNAHHANKAHLALAETEQLSKAVEAALEITDPEETLIIVTADHSHSMTISGNPDRESSIFGTTGQLAKDNLKMAILNYASGKGYKQNKNGRHDMSNDNMGDINYEFPAGVPQVSAVHDGSDVAVFAKGPWAHLFSGVYEQNYIAHAMAYASCVGEGLTYCKELEN